MGYLKKSCWTVLLLVFAQAALWAQPPGGQGRRGPNPGEMLEREKQSLYEKVTDLSDDQKILIDDIYDEFLVTVKETIAEFRSSGNTDRSARREKMQALRQEKDALMADVLNETQYATYAELAARRGGKRPTSDNNE